MIVPYSQAVQINRPANKTTRVASSERDRRAASSANSRLAESSRNIV